MKKKVLALCIIIMLIAISAGGTLSYFTAKATAENVITTGGIHLSLIEKTRKDGILTDLPSADYCGVMPGSTVSRIVTVKNTGTSDAWVRIRLDASFADHTGAPISGTMENGTDVLDIEILPGWKKAVPDDGFYYLGAKLAPGEESAPLFSEVSFHPGMDHLYHNAQIDVRVTAYGVQAAHNGASADEAVGWPQ